MINDERLRERIVLDNYLIYKLKKTFIKTADI